MNNITTDAVASIGTTYSSWVVTLIVFLVIGFTIYALSKNIRQFVLGAVVTAVLIIIYKISRWIGVSTNQGDTVPISWFIYIIAFIFLSIIIGKYLFRLKIVQKWEKNFGR